MAEVFEMFSVLFSLDGPSLSSAPAYYLSLVCLLLATGIGIISRVTGSKKWAPLGTSFQAAGVLLGFGAVIEVWWAWSSLASSKGESIVVALRMALSVCTVLSAIALVSVVVHTPSSEARSE